MNKDKIFAVLNTLKGSDIICYIYRESVFDILSKGRVDGTLYMMSDASSDSLKEGLVKSGLTEVANGKPGYISAKFVGQTVELLCCDDLADEELTDVIRRELSIHSLMMRAKGDIYDVFGGLDDFHRKHLRLTRDEIADREFFTATCFDLILKSGYTVDSKLAEKLNKFLREQPMSKRVSHLMAFRNYIRMNDNDVEYILNILALRGMFPKAPKLNDGKKEELGEKLRVLRPMQNAALACYLCGIKGEQLKSVPKTGFAREFYDCFLRHIEDDLTDRRQLAEAKNNCTKECFETLLAVKEVLALLAGETFSVKLKPVGELFKSIESSDSWRKENESPKKPASEPEKKEPKDMSKASQMKKSENMSEDAPAEPPDEMPDKNIMMEFEGIREENYIEEDQDADAVTVEELPLRRPGENYYLRKN